MRKGVTHLSLKAIGSECSFTLLPFYLLVSTKLFCVRLLSCQKLVFFYSSQLSDLTIITKGQIILKGNYGLLNSSKKWMKLTILNLILWICKWESDISWVDYYSPSYEHFEWHKGTKMRKEFDTFNYITWLDLTYELPQ